VFGPAGKDFWSPFQMIKRNFTGTRVQISVVIALAFLVRFVLATSPPVDIDEALAYAPAALAYLRGDLTMNIEHPMLLKLLFAGSIALFGEHGRIVTLFPWLPESIGAVRLVSTVIGAASCLVIYYLAKEVTSRHLLALSASILLAFDPVSIAESSYGILDPGMTLFYMLSILYFYRYVKDGKGLNFFASAVCFGLAVASKYYALMGIFVLTGIFLWKRKLRIEWKPVAAFLSVSLIVFFAVQPYLWSSPLAALSRSWAANTDHLSAGHSVKPPGNPFLIQGPQLFIPNTTAGPWLYIGSNPVASKPDFYANPSEAVPSPWWYLFYIQAMYSTPFQLAVYPLAACKTIGFVLRRRNIDLTIMGALLVLTPALWFAIMKVRLPQYAILLSTSAVMLGPVAFLGLDPKQERWLIVSLVLFHVGWTLYALSTSGGHFTGWGFYSTPLTPLLANLFGLLWKLTQGFH
jgi:4-amino-4-deoxy-L-arabinose transferase-like glycosyltransferase